MILREAKGENKEWSDVDELCGLWSRALLMQAKPLQRLAHLKKIYSTIKVAEGN